MWRSRGNTPRRGNIGEWEEDVAGFRYLVVTSHYRTTLNFTRAALDGAVRAGQRLNRLHGRLLKLAGDADSSAGAAWRDAVSQCRRGFTAAMDDDLNAPRAMAAVFGLVGAAERAAAGDGMGPGDARDVAAVLEEIDAVLGILQSPGADGDAQVEDRPALPADLARLVDERQKAREERNWARADELRDLLLAAGVTVTDTPEGPTWRWEPRA